MSDGLSLSATRTGCVRSVNDKGFRLDGDDHWLNFSKYALGIVAPARGDTVAVTIDTGGFVRSVTRLDGSPPLPVAGGSQERTGKDRTITRLAVLKAAAEYAASKHASTSSDVLKIAEHWERWVLRSTDPADDLAEAD